MFGGESGQNAFLVPGTSRVRNVVELFIELDRRLSGAVLETSQAARIHMQHFGDQRHVTRGLTECPPDAHPRGVGQQMVDKWRPLEPPLPGHRRRVDAVADRLPIVHERAWIVLGLVHERRGFEPVMCCCGVQGATTLGELAVRDDPGRGPFMVKSEQGGQAGAGLGAQIEVHEGQVPVEAAAQLLIQLIDGWCNREATSKSLLEIRSLTGHVINQQHATWDHR